MGDRTHWSVKFIGGLLFVVGVSLAIGGVWLALLGGSWYYVIAGTGFGFAGLSLCRGRMIGVYVFLAMLGYTALWTLYETGFAFWPSVPRLVAPIFMAAVILFSVPFLAVSQQPNKLTLYKIGAWSSLSLFVIYLAAMFFPHGQFLNDIELTDGQPSKATLAAGNDWPNYGRTAGGSSYAPLNQINPGNIDKLEVAWIAKTGFIADQNKFEQDQTVPLYIDGTIYHCGPVGQLTALDGMTGEIKWQFDPKANSDDWKRCRAISYFDPGAGDECGPRIIETTVDARLISVRADNGQPCATFGNNGSVDIFAGFGKTNPQYLTNSSGAVVANGKIIIGGRVTDNVAVFEPSGVIRAYDALTGSLAWVWDLGNPTLKGLPLAGETYTPGTPNSWPPLSHDAELGLVYIPLGNATPDIYGGERRDFDDAYNSSVVALNIETGDEVWKFQTTRHDLWDYDVPAQPVLADIPDRNGGFIPGLIQVTKRAQTFVLDRRTGKPIKAVENRPAPGGDGTIKGEYYAKTQPYSVEMAAPGTEYLEEKMMWGATPIDQLMCRIAYRRMRYQGDFTTPSTKNTIIWPGPLGGMNFGGVAVDEGRNIMITAEMRQPVVLRLIARNDVSPDMKYEGESGPFAPMDGTPYALERGGLMSPLGIPCNTPPWGNIAAIDLASGKQLWSYPAGTAKDLALGSFQPGIAFFVGLPPLGGPMTTDGIAWYAGTQDYYLRAFNVETGKMIWKGRLPLGSQGNPISYMGKDGRQYVVISASGARYNFSEFGDYIVAFALPDGE